ETAQAEATSTITEPGLTHPGRPGGVAVARVGHIDRSHSPRLTQVSFKRHFGAFKTQALVLLRLRSSSTLCTSRNLHSRIAHDEVTAAGWGDLSRGPARSAPRPYPRETIVADK